ncbi:hypothetical protein B0H21DRAFT_712060 [Amylocystis lapponica]|nr:hypothetical protein B0H21DRAFT_712060 [Amylocystis lapponica]
MSSVRWASRRSAGGSLTSRYRDSQGKRRSQLRVPEWDSGGGAGRLRGISQAFRNETEGMGSEERPVEAFPNETRRGVGKRGRAVPERDRGEAPGGGERIHEARPKRDRRRRGGPGKASRMGQQGPVGKRRRDRGGAGRWRGDPRGLSKTGQTSERRAGEGIPNGTARARREAKKGQREGAGRWREDPRGPSKTGQTSGRERAVRPDRGLAERDGMKRRWREERKRAGTGLKHVGRRLGPER